ncbi:MAG: flagellar protein FlgN [Magnetococcales bacterium]|nr:flagellar protein FlgN [Magnetococcales bacterium]
MSAPLFDAAAETQRLKLHLEPLIGCFERLKQLLERERHSLNARNPADLEESARQIDVLLNEIKQLDGARQAQCLRMGRELGVGELALNLQDLDRVLGGDTGLLAYRQRLRAAIDVAERFNRENQAIFRGVLVATEAMLRVLKAGAPGQTASYDRRGYRQAGPSYHFLSKQF